MGIIIAKYLVIGVAYMTLVLLTYLLSEGLKFVLETFFDLEGFAVMMFTIIAWPIMLAGAIWEFVKYTNSQDRTGS